MRSGSGNLFLKTSRSGNRLRGMSSRSWDGSTSDTKNFDRERTEKVKIDVSSTAKLRKTNVKKEKGLENPVKWNPVDNSVAPELKNRKNSINNPVGQVLSIISTGLRFESLKRVISGNYKRGKVGKKLTKTKEN